MIKPENDIYTDIDERIDAFLKGMMSAEEEQSFKAEIKGDDILRLRVKERLLLIKGIQKFGHHRDQQVILATQTGQGSKVKVQGSKVKVQGSKVKVQGSKRIFSLRRVAIIVSIAACLVIVVLIGQRYLSEGDATGGGAVAVNTNPAMDYAMAQSNAMLDGMNKQLRGGDAKSVEEELCPLFDKVMNGKDIKSGITKLENLYAKATDDNVDSADDFEKEIGWFLALAYMKADDNKKAASILSSLLKTYPDFIETQTLLDKLSH